MEPTAMHSRHLDTGNPTARSILWKLGEPDDTARCLGTGSDKASSPQQRSSKSSTRPVFANSER
eukprot:3652810-Amphidinium_carterae.1